MSGLLVILIFLSLLFFHIPIAIALGVSSIVYCIFFSPLPVDMVVQAFFSGVDSFPLLAVPFFILAGDIMMEGGISSRLINFCSVLMGRVAGALGMITVLASMIFAAISGSGPATVACVGGITIPEMLKEKYDRGFACALAATAGSLGPIIPPSISFIMYGIIAGISITELFLAGVVPGIMMALSLMVLVNVVARKKQFGAQMNPAVQSVNKELTLARAFREAVWSLFVPVIILGGIYGGIFTPTEAAIIACDYALFVGIFVYKEISFKDIPAILYKTILTSGTVLILVAGATAFGRLLTMEQIPSQLAQAMLGISQNPIVILLLINLFLFVVGMLMETLAAIIILSPILLSVVQPLGIDPVHFGVILVMNLVIGQSTPPVGVNLFVAARIGGCKVEDMFRWLLPTVGTLLLVLMLITYVPQISVFLPNLLR